MRVACVELPVNHFASGICVRVAMLDSYSLLQFGLHVDTYVYIYIYIYITHMYIYIYI